MAGRPLSGKQWNIKSVALEKDNAEYVRRSGMNFSKFINDTLRIEQELEKERDVDELEMDNIRQEISRLENQMTEKRMRLKSLMERIDAKKKAMLEINLEKDCGPWYLRMLLQEGRISVTKPPQRNFEILVAEARKKVAEMEDAEILDRSVRFRKPLSFSSSRIMSNLHFSCSSGICTVKDPEPVMNPDPQTWRTKFFLDIDMKMFLPDLLKGEISGTSLLESFRSYGPVIINTDIKREIKRRMEPEYLSGEVIAR